MAKSTSEADQNLKQVLADIEKQFGKGSLMRLGDNDHREIDVISSGSIALDVALGIGGYPKGRIIEIFGPESSGKTTFALHAIAEAQKAGGKAAFIDAENSLDPQYAARLGVDINELLLSQPDNGEQALEITEALVRSGAISVIVIDSVAALVPKAEIEGEMGDSQVGLQARLMSKALRKLASVINKTNTIAIFINQLREKVGVVYGNPEVTPGGRALKFYSSIRLDIRRSEQIKLGTEIVGNKVKVKVVKNKARARCGCWRCCATAASTSCAPPPGTPGWTPPRPKRCAACWPCTGRLPVCWRRRAAASRPRRRPPRWTSWKR